MSFSSITADPDVLGGKPIIRGTRISVEFILELLASGAQLDTIVEKYPHLKREAISEAILYSKHFINNEIVLELETIA